MKIAFFEVEPWEKEIIGSHLNSNDTTLLENKLDPYALPDLPGIEGLVVFVHSPVTAAVLDKYPTLKFIATRSTGYDHIDLAECRKRGITVSYVPGYGDNTVAEFAFGLILALSRKIYQSIDQIKETGSFGLTGLRGLDLKGKTLGVIGTGRIGREAIKMGRGFSMEVIASDPFPNQAAAAELQFTYVALSDLLQRSDFITIHCPYTKDTHHLINQGNIGQIKHGAYLVNTARGAIVETAALVSALGAGILAGAGLDVLEEEGETKDELEFLSKGHPREEELATILENHILMKMPNVLVTPHNAFNSAEALRRILDTTLQNVAAFQTGQPINLVPSI